MSKNVGGASKNVVIFWFVILNFLAIKIVGGIYFSKRAKKLALGVKMSAAQEKMLAV